jgi:hypothetical protein
MREPRNSATRRMSRQGSDWPDADLLGDGGQSSAGKIAVRHRAPGSGHGDDVYTVEQEHGVSHWRVALDSTGWISGVMVTPGLHGVLIDEDEAVSGLIVP